MKKILTFAVMFVMFFAVKSVFAFDWYAGTSLNSKSLGDDDKGTVFAIAPEIGHIFSDKIDAGIGGSYIFDDTSGTDTSEYKIIPFIRYKALQYCAFMQ